MPSDSEILDFLDLNCIVVPDPHPDHVGGMLLYWRLPVGTNAGLDVNNWQEGKELYLRDILTAAIKAYE
jgi:hypothetical protein